MPTRNFSSDPRPCDLAKVLYFLEDGTVTLNPWVIPGEEAVEEEDQGDRTKATDMGDLPWMSGESDGQEISNPYFQLDLSNLPEATDVDSADVEELEPDPAPEAVRSPGFQGGDWSNAEVQAADGERTQIEEIPDDVPTTLKGMDVLDDVLDDGVGASLPDEFSRAMADAMNKACSDEAMARDFASMKTLKPTLAPSSAAAPDGRARTPRLVPQASLVALSAKPGPADGGGEDDFFAEPESPRPPQGALPSHPAHAAAMPSPSAASVRPSSGKPVQSRSQAHSSPAVAASAAHSSHSSSKPAGATVSSVPTPAATGAQDVDEATICLLGSEQALAHYQPRLKAIADEGTGRRREKWAEAALFGQQLFATGRPNPARQIFEKILEESPDESFPYAMYGSLLLALGDEEGAARQYDQALELDSTELCALLGRAELCLRNARPGEAMADVKLAASMARLDSSPLECRATAMMAVVQKLIRFLG